MLKTKNGGHLHTKKYKKMMSIKQKQRWVELKKNPEKLKECLRKIGVATKKRIFPRGPDNCRWRGGKFTQYGYVYKWVENHPFAVKRKGKKTGPGHVMEHRLEMEKKIGRYLTPNEEVHHINGIKDDNRIENLELVTKKTHFGKVTCPHCLKSFKIK